MGKEMTKEVEALAEKFKALRRQAGAGCKLYVGNISFQMTQAVRNRRRGPSSSGLPRGGACARRRRPMDNLWTTTATRPSPRTTSAVLVAVRGAATARTTRPT